MNDLTQFKKQIEHLQKECARAEGSLEHLLQQLEKKTGTRFEREAEIQLEQKKKKLRVVKSKAEKALQNFETKWGSKIKEQSK